jgi:hypothetical protein
MDRYYYLALWFVVVTVIALLIAAVMRAGDCSDAAFSGMTCYPADNVAIDIAGTTDNLQDALDEAALTGRYQTLADWETCLEDSAETHCGLEFGTYELTAPLVISEAQTSQYKTMTCAPGTVITNSGASANDDLIQVTQTGEELWLIIDGCTLHNQKGGAALRARQSGAPPHRLVIRNTIARTTLAGLASGSLHDGHGNDSCGFNTITDVDASFTGTVTAGDMLRITAGAAAGQYREITGVTDTQLTAASNFHPALSCGSGGDAEYSVYSAMGALDVSTFGGSILENVRADEGVYLNVDSGKAILRNVSANNLNGTSCALVTANAAIIVDGLSGDYTSFGCPVVQFQAPDISLNNVGVMSGKLRVGGLHNQRVSEDVILNGLHVHADSIPASIIDVFRATRISGTVYVTDNTPTNLISGRAGGSLGDLNLIFQGDAGLDSIAAADILDTVLEGASDPTTGCLHLPDGRSFTIATGTVTEEHCGTINADTAAALAANGSNCGIDPTTGAQKFPKGIDAAGAAEDCIIPQLGGLANSVASYFDGFGDLSLPFMMTVIANQIQFDPSEGGTADGAISGDGHANNPYDAIQLHTAAICRSPTGSGGTCMANSRVTFDETSDRWFGDLDNGADIDADEPVLGGHDNYTGTVAHRLRVEEKTASDTLGTPTGDEGELGCAVITNEGAAGAIEITLPPAVAGMCVFIVNQTGNNLDVDCDDADSILRLTDNSTGTCDRIQSAAVGDSIQLIAINASSWAPIEGGTWSDVN